VSAVRVLRAGDDPKGWLAGPWESDLPVGIGYATEAIDAPHTHDVVTEIYLVAAGTARAVIDDRTVDVAAGDVVIVEPHEVRSFTASSADYRCFVLHVGGDGGADRRPVGSG
jgi:mannose-6-phosphate isomerase-like protein (cupin superfamily)